MVTFELFARAAIERLSGASVAALPLLRARLTSRFSSQTGSDTISAGASERRRRKRHAAAVARIGRRGRSGARQCVPGGGSGSRSVVGRRRYSSAHQMKKLSHYDTTGRARMVDVSGKARHAPHRDRPRIRPDSPVGAQETAGESLREIRSKWRASRESARPNALRS